MTNIENFKDIMKYISTSIGVRPVGSNGLWLTSIYLQKKMAEMGLNVSVENFTWETHSLENVIGTIEPKGEVEKQVLFVAHYDSVPQGRGSIDNASGVAVIMELAIALKNNYESQNTRFKFIALAGEEVGCVGSENYVKNMTDTEKAMTKCVYNFDMFTYNNSLENPALVVNTMGSNTDNGYVVGSDETPANNIISKCINEAYNQAIESGEQLNELWSPRNYGHSDHRTFHDVQIDSANVTIRGGREVNGKLPQGYHTDKDVWSEKLRFDLSEKFLKVVYNSIIIMDNMK